jgi:low temperature requirement protein LtrA
MMIGIVMLALGLKKVLEYVGDTEHHTISDKLYGVPLWALYGGAAIYLLAHVGFAFRCLRSLKVFRLVTAALLVALVPVMANLPALWSLGVPAVVLIALNTVESIRFRSAREEIRHAGHDSEHPE